MFPLRTKRMEYSIGSTRIKWQRESHLYLSMTLVGVETRYTSIENLCLTLYYSCTQLKCYIKLFEVIGTSHYDIMKLMLSKTILHNPIGKYALALTKFSLMYVPLKAMKGQVVAYFLANYSTHDYNLEQDYIGLAK